PGNAPMPIHDLACNSVEVFLASYGLFRHDLVGPSWTPIPLAGVPFDAQVHDLTTYGSQFAGVGYGGVIATGSGTTWTVERGYTVANGRLRSAWLTDTGEGVA